MKARQYYIQVEFKVLFICAMRVMPEAIIWTFDENKIDI